MSAPMSSKVASDGQHTNAPVVRTLKPPPEIWELVHPVEAKQFNPGQTFLRRLGSRATGLSLLVLLLGLLLGAGFAAFKFRGVQSSTAVEKTQPVQTGSTSSGNDTTTPPNSSGAAIEGSGSQPTDSSVSANSRRATPWSNKRKVRIADEAPQPPTGSETTGDVGANPAPAPRARSQTLTTDEQSTGVTDSNKKSSSDPASTKPKSNSSLSPQVIAPLKSDSPRKAKVIQWP
jgi:cytoskeletal protein RodZ